MGHRAWGIGKTVFCVENMSALIHQDLRTDATYRRGEWPFAPTHGGSTEILRKSYHDSFAIAVSRFFGLNNSKWQPLPKRHNYQLVLKRL
jgi:hypothetical protein